MLAQKITKSCQLASNMNGFVGNTTPFRHCGRKILYGIVIVCLRGIIQTALVPMCRLEAQKNILYVFGKKRNNN